MKLYIPTYNSASFLKGLSPDRRFDVVIIDNCSSDDTCAIAKERGWHIAVQPQPCSRTANWNYAVEHFLLSGDPWCKWLFTGDHLHADCYDILMEGIKRFPLARLIVAEYEISDTHHHSSRWQSLPTTALIDPHEALLHAALLGNWFGSPIAHAFHREAVQKGFTFGTWHWVADMQFMLSMATHSPLLYLKESIGVFNAHSRKVYSADKNSLEASMEEFLIRKQAATTWLHTHGNKEAYVHIKNQLDTDIEKLIAQRSLARHTPNTSPLIYAIPYRTLLSEILLRPLRRLRLPPLSFYP
jgi:hypothetical protein